jgi:hypothetical protein
MTDIPLGPSDRRIGRSGFASAVVFERVPGPLADGRRSTHLAELRGRLHSGSGSSERGMAKGFVDFLLGRGPRHT